VITIVAIGVVVALAAGILAWRLRDRRPAAPPPRDA
jgi:hypothetical protein